ncbi:2,3-bisphosphoglycerate-dependent phosphoglycerate mutase [Neorhodopirellula lusitana]|uniref:2,3-bisphosphoglycerate-dependent phosphoglycerate mutase n=1 Tax=Neorhodopirellula lusitana TaxID=445327 RepID=A0ABY1PWQ7_9BACT|nr:histidine phosphatase family protein [Neorhodopirellula lusitana]SMP50885.1 2,3-bisphosphoglycerate-dependent phosphoglycerate mutase [Neorhodopirellula lusitana]
MMGKPFTVYLIRHAESENNARPVYDRVCDPSITARGRIQSQHLAQWMKTMSLDVLVASPFRRTLQTAQAILDQRDRRTEVWHDIFESGGCFHGHDEASFTGAPGLSRVEIEASLSCELVIDPEIGAEGWWRGQPREQAEQTRARAAKVAQRLISTFDGTGVSVGLVVHADFIRELLSVMLDQVLSMDAVGPIANTSVTTLQFSGAWRLECLNSVTHMPQRLFSLRES